VPIRSASNHVLNVTSLLEQIFFPRCSAILLAILEIDSFHEDDHGLCTRMNDTPGIHESEVRCKGRRDHTANAPHNVDTALGQVNMRLDLTHK